MRISDWSSDVCSSDLGRGFSGDGAVLEPPALVAGLDDVAVVGEAVEERGGHLGVAEHRGPLGKGQVGGDDDRGPLVEAADEVEQELAAGERKRQVAELVEDDELAPAEMIGDACRPAGAGLAREAVATAGGVVEPAPRAG